MDFTEILKHTGHFGRYQKIRIVLLMLGPLVGGIAVTSFIFTGYVPKYRCGINECESISNATYYEKKLLPSGNWNLFEKCERLKFNEPNLPSPVSPPNSEDTCSNLEEKLNQLKQLNEGNLTNEMLTCNISDLVYDKSIVTSSFSIEHEFLCGRHWLKGIFNALYMVGMLIGAFILGLISDHYGRRIALILSVVCVGLAGIISPFTSSTAFFAVLRVIEGIGGMGVFLVPYVMVAESSIPAFTVLFTALISVGWPVGELILAMEAYFLRDHRTLQLVSHAPMLLVIIVILIGIPESTRWLISKNRLQQARKQILRIANINKSSVPEHLLSAVSEPSGGNNEKSIAEGTSQDMPVKRPTLIDLFRPVPIMLRTLNLFLQWFSVTMSYYGLTFASATLKLAGSPYLNFTLNVLIEFVAFPIAILLINRLGRRTFMISTQLVCGICVLIAGNLTVLQDCGEGCNLAAMQTSFYLIGKLGAALCFGMCYLYTTELYPTPLRGTAVGSCSTMARVGGIISLAIAPLGKYWRPLPMTIMGIFAVMSGITAFALPETTGTKLPETMKDALNIGKKGSS